MNMYLETKTRKTDLSEYESFEEVAALVMALLATGHEWVRIRGIFSGVTQWTVLERNERGRPVQIASHEFDGKLEVIACG